MKLLRNSVLALILLTTAVVWGEETAAGGKNLKKDNPPEVLLNFSETSFSGYGALYTRFSKAGDTSGCFAGGRGGLIINDSYVIGAGGMGLAYPTKREKITGADYSGLFDRVEFGYGGVLMEYYLNPKDLIVFSAGTLIGGGSLYFSEGSDDESDNHEEGDNFFVFEPEINVFIHLTRFCRIGAGVSYRFVNGINSDRLNDRDFRSPSASAMVQFGWF